MGKYDIIRIKKSEITEEKKDFWDSLAPRLSIEEQEIRKSRKYAASKTSKVRAKIAVLTHYGNGKLACVKCGFTDIRALSVDHIDGKGYKEWTLRRYDSNRNYSSLRKRNYPTGYQTLCMNCQFIKREEKQEYGNRL